MKIKKIATIANGQDGAIFNGLLFRFQKDGRCSVYSLNALSSPEQSASPVGSFLLDKADMIVPHSNSVCFGREYYAPEDEFPLLYSNIYNNYAREADRRKGLCCVYRIQRCENTFTSTFVQLIGIGFTEDPVLWHSSEERFDVRPYGNFVIDAEKGIYYGFTMRDMAKSTRYFAFRLPRVRDGVMDPEYGVLKVTLQKEDILRQFDLPYHRFIQGACCYRGVIYSLEGFTDNSLNPPAIRIVDPTEPGRHTYEAFSQYGLTVEPELIDFCEDTCYYADCVGNLYTLTF